MALVHESRVHKTAKGDRVYSVEIPYEHAGPEARAMFVADAVRRYLRDHGTPESAIPDDAALLRQVLAIRAAS